MSTRAEAEQPSGVPAAAVRSNRDPAIRPLEIEPEDDSRAWIEALGTAGAPAQPAVARLRSLLLGAARFEATRRRSALPEVPVSEVNDLVHAAVTDALADVLAALDQYRGASRFTTWASKFALRAAAVRLRRLQPHAADRPRPQASLPTGASATTVRRPLLPPPAMAGRSGPPSPPAHRRPTRSRARSVHQSARRAGCPLDPDDDTPTA